jgi:hypothetical protein
LHGAGPFGKVKSHSTGQEIRRGLWSRVSKGPPMIHILSQVNSVHEFGIPVNLVFYFLLHLVHMRTYFGGEKINPEIVTQLRFELT